MPMPDLKFPDYMTDAVKKLIGYEAEPMEATHPVEASEVRRFHHAILDLDGKKPAGEMTVPPTFPTFAFRRALNDPDPLDALRDFPDHDGLDKPFRNLPLIPVPLKRILNGGYEYFFFRYARIGERLFRRSRYRDIYQRNGRDSAMVFAIIDDLYYGEGKDLMIATKQAIILR
jgi:hypothetical protein